MRNFNLLEKAILVLLMFSFFSCSGDKPEKKKAVSVPGRGIVDTQEGFFGWDSITLLNSFTRLEVMPELGGKIMGYSVFGNQILWHNPTHEGEIEIFHQNDLGQEFINAGGAKVWPAPQEKWHGPPDRILDGSPYSFTFDGKNITVSSPEDNGNGRTGLQFTHRYSLRPSSTMVDLNLSMRNCVDHEVKWALWHLATVPVDRKFTVYVPVDEGNWEVMVGDEDNPQWLGVEDGLFRMRYDKRVGKVGMKVREGWAAWHDEENDIVFAMFFTVEKDVEYPHGGHNFEIWTSGAGTVNNGNQERKHEYNPETANMELEVLGPLTSLSPGESAFMDVTWGVCNASGVKRITPIGVIVEDFKIDKNNVVTGKFCVFNGGTLEEFFTDKDGNKKGRTQVVDVSPLSELSLERKPIIPLEAVTLRYQIRGYDNNVAGVLCELEIK